MTSLEGLFRPFTCKSLKATNRFVMAPMTRYFAPERILTAESADYYRRRAEGGIGLIISEGAGLDRPCSLSAPSVPVFAGSEGLAGWTRAVEAVHGAGGAMAPQLWHMGGCPDYNFPDAAHPPLESPSGLIGPGISGGRVMSERDIADTIASYVRAAVNAKRLGFDAVEFHGAHGYLIDQFFWSETNMRKDRFGGSRLADRVRFASDLIREVRRAIGDDFTLILRISQWKTGVYDAKVAATPAELEEWLLPLSEAGVDIFHCSERRFWEPAFDGSHLNLAGWAKKLTGKAVITVGSVGLDRDLFADFESGQSVVNPKSIEQLLERFEREEFDMVAVGRALLADPDWLIKVRAGQFDALEPYSVECMQKLY